MSEPFSSTFFYWPLLPRFSVVFSSALTAPRTFTISFSYFAFTTKFRHNPQEFLEYTIQSYF
jgi:hypothetical protein